MKKFLIDSNSTTSLAEFDENFFESLSCNESTRVSIDTNNLFNSNDTQYVSSKPVINSKSTNQHNQNEISIDEDLTISPTYRFQSTSSKIGNIEKDLDDSNGKRPFTIVDRKTSKRKYNSKNSTDENLRNISDVNIFDNLKNKKCSVIVTKIYNPKL